MKAIGARGSRGLTSSPSCPHANGADAGPGLTRYAPSAPALAGRTNGRVTMGGRRRVVALLVACAIAVGSLTSAKPVEAAALARITIASIWYDSPGTDTRSNTSLNSEYIRIKNTSTTLSRSLKG